MKKLNDVEILEMNEMNDELLTLYDERQTNIKKLNLLIKKKEKLSKQLNALIDDIHIMKDLIKEIETDEFKLTKKFVDKFGF